MPHGAEFSVAILAATVWSNDAWIIAFSVNNIADRTAEFEQLPAAAHYGLGIAPYSPLARGVLSGKYAIDASPAADTRAGCGDVRMRQTEWRPESLRLAQSIAAHAASRGTSSVAFAIAWVLRNRADQRHHCRATHRVAVGSYLDALTLQLGPEDGQLIDSLVRPGHCHDLASRTPTSYGRRRAEARRKASIMH